MIEDLNLRDIKIAYKKLKASVYFDKTQLPLRDEIVAFESAEAFNYEEKLDELFWYLSGKNDNAWEKYIADIIGKIHALVFPKKLYDWDKDEGSPIIFNTDSEPVTLEKAQYFIDMPVIGHILGVLWVLSIGLVLDDRRDLDNMRMYEHSYGNRLCKTLINEKYGDITYSPNLFELYFSQYESWRDKALECAKNRLDNKQDALILALDFKSFYYSVDIQETEYNKVLEYVENHQPWHNRVHEFVYAVLETYSDIVRKMSTDKELQIEERIILPIGFLPSNILSNWLLTPFDDAIITRWNPVYYGRYVDDIIIVDKVERNSPLRKKAQGTTNDDTKLTTKDVVEYYFCSCAADRKVPTSCTNGKELFQKVSEDKTTPMQKNKTVYRINPNIFTAKRSDLDCSNIQIRPDIQIQNDKVKVFYFREGATRALLDCFRTQIAQNASEFRFLPDVDTILQRNDYSEIFQLNSDDSIHKLRGVTGVALDKFSLSKFLGKYRKAGGMIKDKKETAFDKDLLTILDKRALIENYTLWERLLEIMVMNDHLSNYEKLVERILDAIADFKIPSEKVCTKSADDPRTALLSVLCAAISRTAALRWGPVMDKTISNISKLASKKLDGLLIGIGGEFNFDKDGIFVARQNYCSSRMVNKYVMPLPIDCIHNSIFLDETTDICLYKLEDVMRYIKKIWEESNYLYYPYMVTPQELSFAFACRDISGAKEHLTNPEEQRKEIEHTYQVWNYPDLTTEESKHGKKKSVLSKIQANEFKDDLKDVKQYAISVDDGSHSKLRVAVGNARLDERDVQKALTGRANRGFERYNQLSTLLHAAIKENVDLLVFPENYLPWEWVPEVSRLCAKNQMGLITGIEHVLSPQDEEFKVPRTVYNLTAIILPYRYEAYKYSYVTYHQKTHYSPKETHMIEGYRFVPGIGNAYHLFQWRGAWFSVYCCFELASIQERALFQSYADLTVAVEWNKDVSYFSSIIESLCRDLHCYCIQANSSDYGDSRIMEPSNTEKRDIIRTKGGQNSAILVDEIDIHALREFQRKEYELQSQSHNFKPTPPNFKPDIATRKQEGTLWKYFEKYIFSKDSGIATSYEPEFTENGMEEHRFNKTCSMLDKLFTQFNVIIFLDVETTGFEPQSEQIIEFGALRVWVNNGNICTDSETNLLIRLSDGKHIPAKIQKLTGITDELLIKNGVDQDVASSQIRSVLDADRPLIVAYNAQFDLCFLYNFLSTFGVSDVLKKASFLDLLTVYRDRRDYPHKLENAIEAYDLNTPNTHRALDDARANMALLYAMENELDDLDKYINLFGYNPKYGVIGQKIPSIRYVPQPRLVKKKVYE